MDDGIVNDVVMTLGVSFGVAVLGLLAVRRLPPSERLVPQLSLVAHILTAPLLLAIMEFGFKVSDAQHYFHVGGDIARLMRVDFAHWGPESAKFVLRFENDLTLFFPEIYGGMYSTSSMAGTVGFLMFALNDAHYASFSAMAGITFFGKLAGYRGMRAMLPAMNPSVVGVAMMLVPSVVFWSSGVVKESWAITGLGFLTLWLSRVLEGHAFSSPHLLLLGIIPVALIKPYILFPFTLAAGTAYLLARERATHVSIKPLYFSSASITVVVLMLALSNAFPAFSLSEIGSSTATMQRHGAMVEGGSNYSLGNAEKATLAEQITFAPLAVTTVLVRPFIFEVRNFSMLIAALESTALLVLLLRLFRKNTLRSVFLVVRHSPPLAFCFVFSVVASIAIGLATSNFGTLSRYRIPMMPFYVLLVLVLIDEKNGVAAIAPHGNPYEPGRAARRGTVGLPKAVS